MNAISSLARSSSAVKLRHFCSSSLLYRSILGCLLFSAPLGTIILHLGQQGWGWFPSSRITIVSRMPWWMKWILKLVLLASLLCHPSNGHNISALVHGKDARYIQASYGGGGGCGGVGGLYLVLPDRHCYNSGCVLLVKPRISKVTHSVVLPFLWLSKGGYNKQ